MLIPAVADAKLIFYTIEILTKGLLRFPDGTYAHATRHRSTIDYSDRRDAILRLRTIHCNAMRPRRWRSATEHPAMSAACFVDTKRASRNVLQRSVSQNLCVISSRICARSKFSPMAFQRCSARHNKLHCLSSTSHYTITRPCQLISKRSIYRQRGFSRGIYQ